MKQKHESILWQSKVYPDLVMTDKMLQLLHARYPAVKSWQSMMTDLENYLVSKPDKTPKNFRRFVLNCAKRRDDDVKNGMRFPDGKINLKAFENRAPERPKRDPSMARQMNVDDAAALRAVLQTLQRGTPEYEKTLAELRQLKDTSTVMSVGDILKRINETK